MLLWLGTPIELCPSPPHARDVTRKGGEPSGRIFKFRPVRQDTHGETGGQLGTAPTAGFARSPSSPSFLLRVHQRACGVKRANRVVSELIFCARCLYIPISSTNTSSGRDYASVCFVLVFGCLNEAHVRRFYTPSPRHSRCG